eukprot:CAMPEP_0196205358 /NCGR_PEP_ID=MMETSP0912-20130531/7143_1 /TAXON_ID=49265 /ORGANISM="Thalassiosira rotula, Strain GSO102" /LENGTH=57 /DNA_ID=CAMNT_0041479731 /DNA_START=29 /DNA_END=202 /DNA_ORIENTATION=-
MGLSMPLRPPPRVSWTPPNLCSSKTATDVLEFKLDSSSSAEFTMPSPMRVPTGSVGE